VKHNNQDVLWQQVRYRGPDDFVVRSYVLPKLDLIESVLKFKGCSVLDVGCGPGIFSEHLKIRANRVVGTDISKTMLERTTGMELVLADAIKLPFTDKSFDIAFEANLLHHVNCPLDVVQEMTRVARKAVVLIEPNRNNPLMFAFSLLVTHERGGLKFSRRYLNSLVQKAGLSPQHFWTTGMISQNKTPKSLVPLLKRFDCDFSLGEYHVTIATKYNIS
jgi:ubiquinone/menaquinone biosynthesis C-methylase UbiE